MRIDDTAYVIYYADNEFDAIFPDYEEQTFSNLISRIPGIKHISIIIVCGGVEKIMKIIYPDTVPVLKGGYVSFAGVKRIRIHGLRHSHISLLIDLGFSALAIGERVGHEAVDITYHYAHLFPTVQTDMAAQLETEREALVNVRKE